MSESHNQPTQCPWCLKMHNNRLNAAACAMSHDEIVLVPIFREDINRIMQLLLTGEVELVTPRIYKTFYKYFSR